jgi:hypothetical protein
MKYFPLIMFGVPAILIGLLTLAFGDKREKKIVFTTLVCAAFLVWRYFAWKAAQDAAASQWAPITN